MRKVVSIREFRLGCVLVSVVAGSLAQAADEGSALEEVVVTAQRRTENLQDVAIAVSVLSGEALTNKGINNIVELQYAAPGFTVADYGSANVLNIRGIGRSAVDIELPSGVVLYRDGFPTFPGYFQNEPYYDIAAVEVLRGPQGTFVGKSAAGGAVFIRTAAPDLNGFSGKVELEAGNYQQYGGTAVLNMPVSDTFAVRVAAHHEQRDEVLVDSLTGPYTGDPGTPELSSIRVGALWQPSESLNAQLRVDASNLDFGGNITSSYGYPLYRVEQNADFQYRDRSVRTVGNIRYTLANDLVLSSVTGYQRVHTNNNFDRNGSQPSYNRFDSQGVFELYSQEFNLISPDDQGPFSYVLGVFFQRTESDIFDWRRKGFNISFGPAYPTIGLDTPYIKTEDDLSGFVDVKYELTDKLELEVGVRYSNYKLENDTNIVVGDGVSPPTATLFRDVQERDDDDVDGKVSLTYNVGDASNVYAIFSRGHINGGFNIVGGASFDPSEVFNYELGWKATWAGGDVRTQMGAYYQTLSNYQAQFAAEDLPTQNILKNAEGDSKVYGLEASLQAQLGAIGLDFAAAYLDSELGTYPRVVDPFSGGFVTISGGRSPFSPELTLNLGLSYEISASNTLSITPRVDVAYVSESNGSLIENPATLLPSHTLVNAALRFDMQSWYADAWITNAGDKRYVAGIQDIGNIWYPGAPRQYGIRVGVDF
jgi:iron complex outermembrane receptor protein